MSPWACNQRQQRLKICIIAGKYFGEKPKMDIKKSYCDSELNSKAHQAIHHVMPTRMLRMLSL